MVTPSELNSIARTLPDPLITLVHNPVSSYIQITPSALPTYTEPLNYLIIVGVKSKFFHIISPLDG